MSIFTTIIDSFHSKIDWTIAAITMLLICIISSLIPALQSNPVREYSEQFEDELYIVLLKISILVTAPFACDQILDVNDVNSDLREKSLWFFKTMILIGLFVPSILQILLNGSGFYQDWKLTILFGQKMIIIVGSFGTMRRFSLEKGKTNTLEDNFENLSLISILLYLVGFLLLVGFIEFPENQIWFLSCLLVVATGYVFSVFVLAIELFKTKPKGFPPNFSSADDYRDFCYSLATFFYLTSLFIPGLLAPVSSGDELNLERFLFGTYGKTKLFAQIIFTIFLTTVSNRVSVYKTRSGEKKLKARLDMLRYCSHEMRTPLNTAFLGLQIQSQQMQGVIESLKNQEIESIGFNKENEKSESTDNTSLNSKKSKVKVPPLPSLSKSISVELLKKQSVVTSGIPEFGSGKEKKRNSGIPVVLKKENSITLESPRLQLNSGIAQSPRKWQNSGIPSRLSLLDSGKKFSSNENEEMKEINNFNHLISSSRSSLDLMEEETDLTVVLEGLLENIEEVKGSCNVVLQSLNELLMFDKLDEDKVSLDCHMVDPWDFVNEASKPFLANAKHSNIELNIICKDEEFKWNNDFLAKVFLVFN